MTIKDLARRAGVSPASVSRYLNGGPLSQEKRDRIHAAIEETGYQPDNIAQMLRTRTVRDVGLIIPKMDSDAVTKVTAGVTPLLWERGYYTLLAHTRNDPEQELAYLTLLQKRHVAGIIMMATVMTPQHEECLKDAAVPLVVLGQKFKQVACVYHDDYGAANELAGMVIARRRAKLAYIGVTEEDVAAGVNRRRGVQDAMRRFGLDPAHLLTEISPFSVEGGHAAMERLLARQPDIDGVVCATDRIAFGAMNALREAGRRLPEDVSITGMGDSWACEYITPHLTTARFYHRESGETAAQLLLDMIDHRKEAYPVCQTMLGYTIKNRDSI